MTAVSSRCNGVIPTRHECTYSSNGFPSHCTENNQSCKINRVNRGTICPGRRRGRVKRRDGWEGRKRGLQGRPGIKAAESYTGRGGDTHSSATEKVYILSSLSASCKIHTQALDYHSPLISIRVLNTVFSVICKVYIFCSREKLGHIPSSCHILRRATLPW